MKVVVGLVHDPGACAMLIPVFLKLQKELGFGFRLYASALVAKRLQDAQVLFQDIALAQIQDAHTVFTGTSWGSHQEQEIRNQAKKLNIRSVVIIDYWANYLERFEKIDHPIADLTDEICVVDQWMKDEMIKVGFPSKRISVVGHPHLEILSKSSQKRKSKDLKIKNVLILSEPVRFPELDGKFEEASKLMLSILKTVATETKDNCNVHFKFHPKERHEFPKEWTKYQGDWLKVEEVTKDLRFPEDYKNFDLVMGYQSMGLLEAALVGQVAVSVPTIRRDGVRNAFEKAGVLVMTSEKNVIERLKNSTIHPTTSLYAGSTAAIIEKILG